MTVSCTNDYSCFYSTVYCPSDAECNITCIDGNSACYSANIYVENKDYSGLNLDCDEGDSTTCYGADIVCTDSGFSTLLSYNDSNGYFECSSYACCPIVDFDGTLTCSSSDCKVMFITISISYIYNYFLCYFHFLFRLIVKQIIVSFITLMPLMHHHWN